MAINDGEIGELPGSPADTPPDVRPARKRGAKLTTRTTAVAGEEYAKLVRQIRSGCEIGLPDLDDAVLRLQLADDEPNRFSDRIVLIGRSGEIHFSDGVRLMRGLTGIDIGPPGEESGARWEWFEAALIGRLGKTPFRATDRISRIGKPASAGAVAMRVSVRTASHAFSVFARATASTWLNILAGSRWAVDPRPESDYFGIACNMTVSIAHHTMPAVALTGIGAGDIFMPSDPHFTCDGEGTIWFRGKAIAVQYLRPDTLTIIRMEGEMVLDDIVDADQHSESGALASGKGIGTLAESVVLKSPTAQASGRPTSEFQSGLLAIDFELGRIAMSFGHLRALKVGSVIEVTGGSTASIRIVCGGQILGCGEVVDVNGQLGIRVTQWDCQS